MLDLGSGGGIDVLVAARLVGSAGRVRGLDMTPDMIALARKNASEAGIGNVEWTNAGTNPRGRDLSTDPAFPKRDVARLRKQLARDEWDVPARPLPVWFA